MALFSPGNFNSTNPLLENKNYLVKLADLEDEVIQSRRLRFEVFNLELGEGLDASFKTGLDKDKYDEQCYHLVVMHKPTNKVVASYRVQDYATAQSSLGFYNAERFDFDNYPLEVQQQGLETTRACIARNFRNSTTFFLLWKGLAKIMHNSGNRYFFGCGTIPSDNMQDANGLVQLLRAMSAYHQEIYIEAAAAFKCPYEEYEVDISKVQLPTIFNIYLRFYCETCSAPCFDRDFKAIAFMIMMDLHKVPRNIVEHFSTNR